MAAALVMVANAYAQVPELQYDFRIEEAALGDALSALAIKAGVQLIYPHDLTPIAGVEPVIGRYTVEEALNILLRGTGFSGGLSKGGVIVISLEQDREANQMASGKFKEGLLASAAALLFGAGGAHAQDGEDSAERDSLTADQIVVTASKRSAAQSVMDVPMGITAMTGDMLKKRGVQNINDLSYVVPNLSVNEIGPGQQSVAIRGVGNIQGQGSLVGIYVDESPVSLLPVYQLDLRALDLERVEVLKGPQGTLYGAGAVGGTIRYITKAPSFEGVGGSLGLSLYNTHKGGWSKEISGALNIPVVEDVLAFRVAGTYEDKAGWIDQPDIGAEDINDHELSHVRVKALWRPAEKLEINMMAMRHRGDGGGLNLINFGAPAQSFYRSAVDRDASPGFSHDYDLYNLTVGYDLGFATLTSASSYLEFETKDKSTSAFFTLASAPTGVTERIDYGFVTEAELFSQEVRLSSNGEGALAWTVGAFYSDAEDTLLRTGELKQNRPGFPPLVLPPATMKREQFSESVALFADISYDITDKLTIGGGTRYFEEDKESDGRFFAHNPKKTFSKLSSRVYASYALSDEANVYLNIAEGFRSGGFNTQFAAAAGDPTDYDSETVTTFEVGTKARLLDNRLTAELAVFLSKYKDYQGLTIAPDLSGFVTSNSAEAEIKGVEWNLQWRVLEALSLGFSGNVTDTEFTKVDRLPAVFEEGDQLNNIPDYSYSVNLDYRFELTDSADGFARLDFNRQGESTATNRSGTFFFEELRSDSVSFLNARLGAQWGVLSVELFGENLLDEDRSPMVAIVGLAPQSRPRTIGVKLNYDF